MTAWTLITNRDDWRAWAKAVHKGAPMWVRAEGEPEEYPYLAADVDTEDGHHALLYVSLENARALMDAKIRCALADAAPTPRIFAGLEKVIEEMMADLTPRERAVLRDRFGIDRTRPGDPPVGRDPPVGQGMVAAELAKVAEIERAALARLRGTFRGTPVPAKMERPTHVVVTGVGLTDLGSGATDAPAPPAMQRAMAEIADETLVAKWLEVPIIGSERTSTLEVQQAIQRLLQRCSAARLPPTAGQLADLEQALGKAGSYSRTELAMEAWRLGARP